MSTSPTLAELPATFVVELTPPGRGAVAIVLVAGSDALRAVSACFAANSGRPLADAPINRIVVGRWDGAGGEELVVCRRSDEEIEVHCHGGMAAVRAVVDALVAQGCREIGWREWLRGGRFSLGRDIETRQDSTTADAEIALADAVTLRTATILVDQLNGGLSRAIREVLTAIQALDWPQAARLADELWERRDVGLHLTSPWRVVFAGPPNVGKSSLMNALAGFERAIVSPTPGTTRDVVTLATAIDGWPVQLADTAGLRPTTDEIESAGVALAETALANADLAILVTDATQPTIADSLKPRSLPPRVLHVRNKTDLVPTTAVALVMPRTRRQSTPARLPALASPILQPRLGGRSCRTRRSLARPCHSLPRTSNLSPWCAKRSSGNTPRLLSKRCSRCLRPTHRRSHKKSQLSVTLAVAISP
jgi:tRNA modification GTPase